MMANPTGRCQFFSYFFLLTGPIHSLCLPQPQWAEGGPGKVIEAIRVGLSAVRRTRVGTHAASCARSAVAPPPPETQPLI